MSLLFNTLSRFVIAFLPRSNLLISWLQQSPSTVILELKKRKYVNASTFSHSVCHEVMGLDVMLLVFGCCLFNLHTDHIMGNAGLDELQAGIKIARRNINNFRYVADTNLMAESKEGLKSLLMKVEKESERAGLKSHIQKKLSSWHLIHQFMANRWGKSGE